MVIGIVMLHLEIINNNTINNTVFAIALDYHEYAFSGINNVVSFNNITNTSDRAITVWNFYKNFTINNNYIDNATTGIWIYDDGNYGDISNGINN